MDISDPAFNYDRHGSRYAGYRRTDPRIAAHVWQALGQAIRLSPPPGGVCLRLALNYCVSIEMVDG